MKQEPNILRHPSNGTSEQTGEGFSWFALFFGEIWLLIKGLYGHFFTYIALCICAVLFTGGIALPFIWVIYGLIGHGLHRNNLLKRGYLTTAQWNEKKKRQQRSTETKKDATTQLRELSELHEKGVITENEFNKAKSKILS